MIDKCANCPNEGEHWHHIVPKSRGGSDNPTNLILLCLDCHSKAHDVSFKSSNGMIKEAVKRTKEDWLDAAAWWRENEDILLGFFEFLYDEERDYHDFLLSGLNTIKGLWDGFVDLVDYDIDPYIKEENIVE